MRPPPPPTPPPPPPPPHPPPPPPHPPPPPPCPPPPPPPPQPPQYRISAWIIAVLRLLCARAHRCGGSLAGSIALPRARVRIQAVPRPSRARRQRGRSARWQGAAGAAGVRPSRRALAARQGEHGQGAAAAVRPVPPTPAGASECLRGAPSPRRRVPLPLGARGPHSVEGLRPPPRSRDRRDGAWGYLVSTVDDGRDTVVAEGRIRRMLVAEGASTVARQGREEGRAGQDRDRARPAPRAAPGCPPIPRRARPDPHAPGGPGSYAGRPAAAPGLRPPPRAPQRRPRRPALRRRELRRARPQPASGARRRRTPARPPRSGPARGWPRPRPPSARATVALAMAMLGGARALRARPLHVRRWRVLDPGEGRRPVGGGAGAEALRVLLHAPGGQGGVSSSSRWRSASMRARPVLRLEDSRDHDPFSAPSRRGSSRPGFPRCRHCRRPREGCGRRRLVVLGQRQAGSGTCPTSCGSGDATTLATSRLEERAADVQLGPWLACLRAVHHASGSREIWREATGHRARPTTPCSVLEHYEVSYGASGDGAAVAEWVERRASNKWTGVLPGCEPARASPDRYGRHRHAQGMCRAGPTYLAVTGMEHRLVQSATSSLEGKEIASGSRGLGRLRLPARGRATSCVLQL